MCRCRNTLDNDVGYSTYDMLDLAEDSQLRANCLLSNVVVTST